MASRPQSMTLEKPPCEEYQNFESLTRKLIAVPNTEVPDRKPVAKNGTKPKPTKQVGSL